MSVKNKRTEHIKRSIQNNESMEKRILIVVFGLIETLLGFRLIFKFAGANPANTLIKVLYTITDFMVSVFASIFTPVTNEGIETLSIIEPGTIIAMIVVALIALGTSKLMSYKTSESKDYNQTIYVEKEEN